MSSLTQEQRQRIEENKRKALAKRTQRHSPIKCSSQDQRQRIEENRQKALALRAEKQSPTKVSTSVNVNLLAAQGVNEAVGCSHSSNTFYSKQSDILCSLKQRMVSSCSGPSATGSSRNTVNNTISSNSCSNLSRTNAGESNNKKTNVLSTGPVNKFQKWSTQPSYLKQGRQQSNKDSEANLAKIADSIATSGGPPQSTLGGGTTAKCLLISRKRFEVSAGYYPPIVDLFKSMTTKKYGM